ncbi:MAG TPA: acyl-CoA synthetase [Caldimonas sp.]|nr:acyl-CoA synthetase [Caldimonas sp.]
MKVDGGIAPTAAWTQQRERSSRWQLRVMRAVATFAGRRATRLLLHPIVCAYILDRRARHHSARYLTRALGRPATWGDVYRHLHTFSATVLDRVYLLQERFDLFRFQASGVETILEPFGRGEGVLAFGAHLGSFEALRTIGHDKGLRVAMIMYADNARLINETLAALAPRAELHTIELGRIDAMLSIRRWLDDGGVAGLLADRSLPTGNPQRSKAIALPFLGAPACFPDGPFRLAAMLRRRVVFMAGLYRGGRDYDLRFVELADFSGLAGTGPAAARERDGAVRDAMQRYVSTLEALCREAPYNWFNFYDFWADVDTPDPSSTPR